MSPPREKISHRICTINPLPVQQEQSTEEQPSFQTSLDCRGQTPVPPPQRKKPPAQCKSPCPCYASYLCSFPSRCPIITLLNCTAVGTFIFRLLHGRFQPNLAPLVLMGAVGSVTLRGLSSCSAKGWVSGGASPSARAFARARY